MISESEIASAFNAGKTLLATHTNGNTYELLGFQKGKADGKWLLGVEYQNTVTNEKYWRPITDFRNHELVSQ